MTKRRLDDVYKRFSDCTDASRLYGADIYYHSTCMRNYIREEESHVNPDIISVADANELDDIVQSNRDALEEVLMSLMP